jgi:hypothetical protein
LIIPADLLSGIVGLLFLKKDTHFMKNDPYPRARFITERVRYLKRFPKWEIVCAYFSANLGGQNNG